MEPEATGDVEVRQLRAFVVVAETLNFSRAAELLYVSQPALSRQIRALERGVGCELFQRSTRHVALTLAGEALLDRARPVLAALDDAVAAAQSVGGEMAARIMRLWAPVAGVSSALTPIDRLRDVFETFVAQFPVPDGVAVRAVNTAGVPGLVLGDDPAILYLHGGGYLMGSAYGYRPLAAALVAAADRGAIIPDYRLAPEHPFPAALDDVTAAYQWLITRRTDPVAIAADSTGAGLAFGLLQRLRATNERMPACVALLCPAIDLTGALLTPSPDRTHPMEDLARIATSYLGEHPIDDPLVAPLNADLTGLPPLLIQCGTGDRTLPEAEQLAERARNHGVSVRLQRYPVDAHVFHAFSSFLPEARAALREAGSFLSESLA